MPITTKGSTRYPGDYRVADVADFEKRIADIRRAEGNWSNHQGQDTRAEAAQGVLEAAEAFLGARPHRALTATFTDASPDETGVSVYANEVLPGDVLCLMATLMDNGGPGGQPLPAAEVARTLGFGRVLVRFMFYGFLLGVAGVIAARWVGEFIAGG